MINVLVPLMTDFEEIEAVTIIDILRRAGITVVTAGLSANPIVGAHGIAVLADVPLDLIQAKDFNGIILPGGKGTPLLHEDARIQDLILEFAHQKKTLAAICAAPIVLSKAGVLKDKQATSYPSVRAALEVLAYREDSVVIDGAVITSRGAGTAMAFALELVAHFIHPDQAQAVAAQVLAPWSASCVPHC